MVTRIVAPSTTLVTTANCVPGGGPKLGPGVIAAGDVAEGDSTITGPPSPTVGSGVGVVLAEGVMAFAIAFAASRPARVMIAMRVHVTAGRLGKVGAAGTGWAAGAAAGSKPVNDRARSGRTAGTWGGGAGRVSGAGQSTGGGAGASGVSATGGCGG